jgi:hypothetical protein
MKNQPHEEHIPKNERLCHLLDIPTDSLPFGYSMEIQGRSLLKLRGGGRITLYTPDEIRVALPRASGCTLSVKGARLSCVSYNKGTLGIEGCILSVSFESADRSEAK